MQIHWNTEKTFLAYYYIHQARQIQNGYFQRIRALILPRLTEDSWYFPDYGVLRDDEFVRQLESVQDSRILRIDNEYLVSRVVEQLDLFPDAETVESLQSDFSPLFLKVDAFLESLFLHYSAVHQLHIIPTVFGTGASYFISPSSEGYYTLYITCRVDKGASVIIHSLISALIHIENTFDEQNLDEWMTRRHISDFLLHHTKLRTLMPAQMLAGTVHFLEEYKGEIAEESAQYLTSLGYPLPRSFSYTDTTILFNNEPILGLDHREIEVLKELIDNRLHIVSFEQAGDRYWGKDAPEKFSLAALAKVAERIRKVFSEQGIPIRCFQTVRKKGYLLYD